MTPLTWEEVRDRSIQKMGKLDVYCAGCFMAFSDARLPCRKHATAAESDLIDKHVDRVLSTAYLPLTEFLAK